MTVYARDASKFTVAVTPAVIQGWRDAGVGLVIVQSHPAEYGRERSLDIMRALQAAGMLWDAYLYMYLAYPDWVPSALETLDLAAAEGLLPRKVWGDVEDVDSGKGWGPGQRVLAVNRDLILIDQWAADHGLPRVGVYGAKWYWDGYLANTTVFRDRQLWNANYDNVADTTVFTPYGGWVAQDVAIKQYMGSQPDGTDLDCLSAAEEAELTSGGGDPDVDDAERAQLQERIDSLTTAVAYLGDDQADRLYKVSTGKKVRAVADEMRRVRLQMLGPRG